MISATARSGNPAAALQLARAHEELLRTEAAIDPDPELTRLANRIRAGTFPERAARAGPPLAETTRATEVPGARPEPAREAPRGLLDRLRVALGARFSIGSELQHGHPGGATRSYGATDARYGRAVVLKALHPTLASQLDARRFLREIGFTARLHHPHLVPLLESGEAEGSLWFTMPAVAGRSLRDRLASDPLVPVEEALRLTVEVADALDYAHRHGVVHRDVSPENILLAERHAFLINLGVARALESAATSEVTEAGMLVGTPAYMSPEQAAGQVQVDARSDVYSLACVLFEMLAGEPLHSGPTPQAIMAKRQLDVRPRLRTLSHVPARVLGALRAGLASDPRERCASAAIFAGALGGMSEDAKEG